MYFYRFTYNIQTRISRRLMSFLAAHNFKKIFIDLNFEEQLVKELCTYSRLTKTYRRYRKSHQIDETYIKNRCKYKKSRLSTENGAIQAGLYAFPKLADNLKKFDLIVVVNSLVMSN